jgi:tight adherence protein C
MDTLTGIFKGMAGTAGSELLFLLLFVGVILAVYGLAQLLAPRDPVAQRLLAGVSSSSEGVAAPPLLRHAYDSKLKELDRLLAPSDPRERSRVGEWLAQAGYRGQAAARIYYASRAALGFGAMGICAFFLPMLPNVAAKASPPTLVGATIVAGVIAFFVPTVLVQRRVAYRRQAAQDGFPDALDMLLVCVEAGQGLDQAMARMAREIAQAHPVLAEEFTLVGLELRAGKERAGVLHDFARRLNVPDISAFVTVLRQSDEYGTTVGEALRVYASEMRDKRMMAAEEKAQKMPLKLALGTMLFTVPPLVLILIGPSVLQIIRVLGRFSG